MGNIFSKWYGQISIVINSENKNSGTNSALLFENFIMELVNELFSWEMQKLPANYPGIDLVDNKNKIAIQVKTSKESKNEMIRKTLENLKPDYLDYEVIVISLKQFSNKKQNINTLGKCKSVQFWDFDTIIGEINSLNITKQEKIKKIFLANFKFLKNKEDLSKLPQICYSFLEKLQSNEIEEKFFEQFSFEIQKKIEHNELGLSAIRMIKQCSVYSDEIDEIYNDFRKKSNYVPTVALKTISDFYIYELNTYNDEKWELNYSNIFFEVLLKVFEWVKSELSDDFRDDDIKTASDIITVNAFLNCRILEKP